jgi:hypothetical protein
VDSSADSAARRFAVLINTVAAERHLDLLCALVAATIDPSADVGSMLVGLDKVADLCPTSFEGIIDTLFSSGLFSGDSDDYHDPRNSLLHEVLARRVGMPITLSLVAIEVGKRHNLPIVGVGLPGHFVVRDKQSGTYADPFAHGVRYDEVGMITSWQQRMGDTRPRHRPAHPQQPQAQPPVSTRAGAAGPLDASARRLSGAGRRERRASPMDAALQLMIDAASRCTAPVSLTP